MHILSTGQYEYGSFPASASRVNDALPELAARRGDFEDWFSAGLRLDSDHLAVFDPRGGADFPRDRRVWHQH